MKPPLKPKTTLSRSPIRKQSSSASKGVGEKLQKILARQGLGSRREIEGWIESGRVSVEGSVSALGDRAVEGVDKIRVDGRLLRPINPQAAPKTRILLYHKPEGEMCTRSDPEGRKVVFDALPKLRQGRWVMVGRLDINSSGLLLFTTDGALANQLMHPSFQIEREYATRVLGEVTPEMIKALKAGVMLDDGKVGKFIRVKDAGGEGANHWYHVILKEGRHREVRKLWATQGVKVSRLIRIRYGMIALPRGLRAGKFVTLSEGEVKTMLKWVKSSRPS